MENGILLNEKGGAAIEQCLNHITAMPETIEKGFGARPSAPQYPKAKRCEGGASNSEKFCYFFIKILTITYCIN